MRKIIFSIIIFFLICSPAFSLIVEDLGQQITEETTAISSSLVETKAEIKALQSQINSLKETIAENQQKQVLKEDLPELYANIEAINFRGLQNQLIMLLMFSVFVFSAFFIFSSRKWV